MKSITLPRLRRLLKTAAQTEILVVGDAIIDQFLWGRVSRISPEAPVPVLDFERESFMPGGAANIAHNLAVLEVPVRFFGWVGSDESGRRLRRMLGEQGVGCDGLLASRERTTSSKTRIIAHQQQVVRVDRERRAPLTPAETRRLLDRLEPELYRAAAVIVGDYGKGTVIQPLLDALKQLCRERAVWLSLDPKPVHPLDLSRLSLITPNRKEVFALAEIEDETRTANPLQDTNLRHAADKLLDDLRPALLLITLGEHGMLLCQRGAVPYHIPTVAREVFDVSGAGDTVIASFTLAIAAGASPVEAAVVSNHAAGVVVGKVGTATVTAKELEASFREKA